MDIFSHFLIAMIKDFQPGRFLELFLLMAGAWWKLKPHLTKIEGEVSGLKDEVSGLKDEHKKTNAQMKYSFDVGDQRFYRIETRLDKIENTVQP